MRTFCAFVMLIAGVARGAIPDLTGLEGALTTVGGGPVPDDAYGMVITLYADEAGTQKVYSETLAAVIVAGGRFATSLGPLPAGADAARFVGVAVKGEPELPLVPIRSVLFALRASSADAATTSLSADLALDVACQGCVGAADIAPSALAGFLPLAGGAVTGDLSVQGRTTLSSATFSPGEAPAACDAGSAGTVYFDKATSRLYVCTGAAYARLSTCDPACPAATDVPCGDAIASACGDTCGGQGTGLHSTQCLYAAQTTTCGVPVEDGCQNACGLTGTAFDETNCPAAAVTACGVPVTDGCGNACGTVGQKCAAGSTCDGTSCVLVGGTSFTAGLSCKDILDKGGSQGDGTYWIDPDAAGGDSAFQVYCDMTSYGGGWTRCLASKFFSGAKPTGWSKSTWLSTPWKAGTSFVLDSAYTGGQFGFFCSNLSGATQIYGEATYPPSTTWTPVKTPALALPAGFFKVGANVLISGTGTNAIAIDSSAQGRYGSGCTSVYTSNTTQGMQSICIQDASHQQTMHTGWTCGQLPGSCADSCNQPCYCSQDSYCGGSDKNENSIVMLLYVR